MSGSVTLTVAAAPSTTQTASTLLSLMGALSGTATDYVIGSQIRTLAETVGAVVETEGVAGQALAFESLVLGALSLFGIQQPSAIAATGLVTFASSLPVSAAPIVPQAVTIPANTLVQTAGGILFQTLTNTTLASGTASVIAGVTALVPGAAGNINAGSIQGQPLTSIGYPLYVTNVTSMSGGSDAGTQSSALALFNAKVSSLGLSSPVAVANAAIGVTSSGTGETVQFASVYEPWLAAGTGAGSGVAGFQLFVDNGTGSASPSLLAAVTAWLNGSVNLNQSGFRPAGVPFTVAAVTPVFASAAVSGLLFPGFLPAATVSLAVSSGITAYFNGLGFAPAAAYQSQIAGAAADAGMSAFESLTTYLYYGGSSTPVTVVSGSTGTRVILTSLSVNIGVGS
jgi:hypothetical protein